MENYEFELFDIRVRRLQNGNKLRLTFEIPYNLDIEKHIIDLRQEHVKLTLKDLSERIILDKVVFEVFDIKVRKLSSNDRLSFVLENMYDKEVEKKVIDMRFDDVKLQMEIVDKSLFDQIDGNQELEYPEDTEDEIIYDNER
jgi:hypothetical protein